ncbi:hypothetical protein PENSPDRAFT_757392 [Peniophora sp. CONT]|nr:hypothetical protein PENSPDRAFT_757392 [Peniophora sp. CONT]
MSDSEESTISDYQSAISDEGSGTSGPIFGPQIARAVGFPALGKPVRLRIDLQWCRGLREFETARDGSTTRASSFVRFEAITAQDVNNFVWSSSVQVGTRSHRGTAQWDEILYIECFERCILQIQVFSSTYEYLGEAYRPVSELLTRSEVQIRHPYGNCYTLCLSASMIHVSTDDDAECGHDMQIGSNLENQHGRIHVDPGIRPGVPTACIANSLHTIMSQLLLFMEVIHQLKASFDIAFASSDAYSIQEWTYTAYREC